MSNDNEVITRIDHPALIELMRKTGGQLGRKLAPPPGTVEALQRKQELMNKQAHIPTIQIKSPELQKEIDHGNSNAL